MGTRRHGQEGALAPSGNVVKCFCALVVTAKRSAYELLLHYFHCQSFVSGDNLQIPPSTPYLAPLGDFHPRAPNLLHPWKNSAGSRGR